VTRADIAYGGYSNRDEVAIGAARARKKAAAQPALSLSRRWSAFDPRFLPSYAPELNPVEYIWAWMKKHALANYCPDTFGELSTMAKSKLQSVNRRKTLILAFWKQAELPL
jgi:transposase